MGNSAAVPETTDASELDRHALHCRRCRETYDLERHAPLVLPCNHITCKSCITAPPHRPNQVICPICYVHFDLGLSDLPMDPYIVRRIEFLDNHRRNICDFHGNLLLNFFCKTCFEPTCSDCHLLNHKQSEGHEVISIHIAVEENFTLFDDIENTNTERLRDFQGNLLGYDALLQADPNNDPNIEIQIRNKFAELRTLLQQRENHLISELARKREERMALLEAQRNIVGLDIQELSGRLEDFKIARREGNVRNAFRLYKEFQSQSINERHTALDSQLFPNLSAVEYQPRNEDTWIEATNQFGEIV